MKCLVRAHDTAAEAAVGSSGVCAHCAARGATAVRDLLRAYVGLVGALGRSWGGSSDEPVSAAAPGSSAPLRVPVHDLLTDIWRTIVDWEDTFRAERGWSPRPRRPSGPTFQHAVATLDSGWDLLLESRRFPAVVDDVLHLRERAHRLLRWTDLLHALPLPCPRCGLLELHRPNGQDWQTCHSCRLFVSPADYAAAVRRTLKEAGCPH